LKAEEKHIRRAKKNNFKLEIEEENVSYKNSFGVRVQKIKIQKAFHKIHLIFLMFKSTLMIFKMYTNTSTKFYSILLQGISKPRCIAFYVSMYREARND